MQAGYTGYLRGQENPVTIRQIIYHVEHIQATVAMRIRRFELQAEGNILAGNGLNRFEGYCSWNERRLIGFILSILLL
jgi:hypothetical protein